MAGATQGEEHMKGADGGAPWGAHPSEGSTNTIRACAPGQALLGSCSGCSSLPPPCRISVQIMAAGCHTCMLHIQCDCGLPNGAAWGCMGLPGAQGVDPVEMQAWMQLRRKLLLFRHISEQIAQAISSATPPPAFNP